MNGMRYSERMNSTARPAIEFPPTIGDLGYAAFNMTYDAFCKALGEPDGQYATAKFAQFKAIGRALNTIGWSDATFTTVVNAYKAERDN